MSVRDLEQEGVLPAPAKSYGFAEFSVLTNIITLQAEIKAIKADYVRLNELVKCLLAKQLVQPVEAKGFYIKEEFRTP